MVFKVVKNMSKKSSGKMAFAIIVMAALLVAGVAGTWYYMDLQNKALETRATSLQNQLAAGQVSTNPAYVELTDAGDFDFIDEIDANGGVAADDTPNDATPAPTLVIENKDTTDAATNVYITMWDPESSKGGVPTALEDTSMSFYVTWNGMLVPLYICDEGVGEYTNGVNLGTIAKGGSTGTITFSAVVDAAADDTYDDSGATYTIKIFVYQADSQDSTPISYTLST